MILPIYTYGSAVLREKARPIEIRKNISEEAEAQSADSQRVVMQEEELRQLMKDMYETMKAADGVGIAAPQVGRGIRLLIVDGTELTDDYPELKSFIRYMINPEILEESSQTAEYSEGCLSIPDIHCDVVRPSRIKVRYINEKFEEVTESLEGFGCRMVQHEIDHLEGHMFVDRVSPIRRKLLTGKLRKLEEGNFRARYKVALVKK